MRLRSTKPMFLLTGKKPLTIFRNTVKGQFVRGIWQKGEYEEIVREVNIQPLRYHEILLLPEAERTRQWYSLWCAEDLRTDQEIGFLPDGQQTDGWDADEFVYEGYRYKIMKVHSWDMGVLDHFAAQAARIEVTPN